MLAIKTFLFKAKRFCRQPQKPVIYVCCLVIHSIYSRNDMRQKCEGNCGLWVLNEMIKKIYSENLKKIVGAVWELPAK